MHEHAAVRDVETDSQHDQGSTHDKKSRNASLIPSFLERKSHTFIDRTARAERSSSEQNLSQHSSVQPPVDPSLAAGAASLNTLQQSSIHKSKSKKMSLTTFFQYVHTTHLPLPSLKPGQHPRDVGSKALSVAISLLQSPETMACLNPLVEKFEQVDPSNPENKSRLVPIEKLSSEFNVDISDNSPEFAHFEITDKFSLPFGYSKNLIYHTAMRNILNGMESLTDPGSGVSLHAKWTVKESETHPGEFLELTEVDYIHCNVFLGVYIRSQLDSSHKALHDGFVQRFMEGMGHPVDGWVTKMDGPRQN